MSVIHNIEIDHCPACKGVWLDRGELDKIIERSNSFESYSWRGSEYHGHHEDCEKHYKHDDDHHEGHHRYSHDYDQGIYGNQTPRRKSFFSELFDF